MDRALIFFKILLGHQNCDHALQNQRVSGDSSGFSQSKTEIPAPSSRLQVTAPGALGREAMKVTGFRVVQTVVYDYDASTGRWFCLLILIFFCLSCDVLWLYMMIYVYDVYCWIIRYWDEVVWWTQKMNMKCLCSAGLLMHLNHLPLEKQRYTSLYHVAFQEHGLSSWSIQQRGHWSCMQSACRLCLERRIADSLSSFPVVGRLLGGECKLVHLINACLSLRSNLIDKMGDSVSHKMWTTCLSESFNPSSIYMVRPARRNRYKTPKPFKLTSLQTKIANTLSWSRLMPADTQPCWMGSESDAKTNKWSLQILLSIRATDIYN